MLQDEALGSSLDALPRSQLPLVRKVLQQYQAFGLMNPKLSATMTSVILAYEMKQIWN